MSSLLVAIILTLLPITELRVGLPVALIYSINNGIPPIYIFSLILILNLFLIFFIFFFLDKIHHILLKWNFYKKLYTKYIKLIQSKLSRFKKNHSRMGFLALTLLVAIPLPLTGVYTGSLSAWLLNLDRRKSIYSIALGVLIAGIIIYFGTLGVLNFLN